MQEYFSRWYPVFRPYLPLGLAIVGLMFFVYGLIGFPSLNTPTKDIAFEGVSDAKTPKEMVFVDIQGAVVKPGVYRLSSDARIQDLLVASGGLSAGADRTWSAKNINLAQKLVDAQKVYIPFVQEAPALHSEVASANTTAISDKININVASSGQLDSLAGIGPQTAQKIIDGRPYRAIDELLNKKLVNKKVFDQIKDKITVY